MKTIEFEDIIKELQKATKTGTSEAFTTRELAHAMKCDHSWGREWIRRLIGAGIAAYVGKVPRPSIHGHIALVPGYALTDQGWAMLKKKKK